MEASWKKSFRRFTSLEVTEEDLCLFTAIILERKQDMGWVLEPVRITYAYPTSVIKITESGIILFFLKKLQWRELLFMSVYLQNREEKYSS